MAVEGGHPSIEIDYESLSAAERDPFSRFIDDLAGEAPRSGQAARGGGPCQGGDREVGRSPGAGLGEIGAAAGRVIVLTYDYDPARPSPIAPLSWTKDVLRHAVSRIDPTKVVQGVPLYGYDWASGAPCPGANVPGVARARPPARRPAASRVARSARRLRLRPWPRPAPGVALGWCPVAALLALGREVGIGGYAFWRLGGEIPPSGPLAAERAALSNL